MRFLKIGGLWLGALLGLSVLCIVLALGFFNPNAYRAELAAWASKQTGRAVTIQGELSWRLSSPLVVNLPRLRLANPAGFADTESGVELTRATIRIALRPLLRHQLQLGALELQGLRVHLQRSADGRDNWSDLLQLLKADSSSRWKFVGLAALQLQQGEFSYVDASTASELHLSDLQVELGQFAYGQSTPLTLQTRLSIKPDYVMNLQLSSSLQIPATAAQLRFSRVQLDMQINRSGQPMPPLAALIEQLQWDQPTDQLRVQGLQLTTLDASLKADLSAQPLTTLPTLTATLAVQVPMLRELARQWGMPLPATRDPSVLQTVNANVQLQASAQSGRLGIMQLQLDDTHYDGEFAWADPASPDLTFRLHADQLNLDRYLAASPAVSAPQAVPLQWLQQLKARGRFTIDDAQWQGIRARHLTLDLDGE